MTRCSRSTSPRSPAASDPPACRSPLHDGGMKLGIVTPVVTRLPRAHAQWEEEAGIAEIARVTRAAEDLGYDFVTCSEHVAVPVAAATRAGGDLLGSAPDLRIPRRGDDPHPVRDVRARARLPPPARDREAVRHARRRERRPARPRRRAWGASKRSSRCSTPSGPPRGARSDDALRALRVALSQRGAGVPGPALRVRRDGRRPVRGAGARPDLGRRPHRSLAAARGRARRRLGAVRPAQPPSSRSSSTARAAPRHGSNAPTRSR